MSGFKQLLIIALCCLLSSCGSQRLIFNESTSINAAFLKEIPESIRQEESFREAPVFTKAVLYKTSFKLQYAEAENVLVEAMLQDSSVLRPINYMEGPYGFRQNLYLLALKSDRGKTYFVYFSVWYNDAHAQPQLRFGPAYWGKMEDSLHTITFAKDLVMKEAGAQLYLKPQQSGRQFFFVLDNGQIDSTVRVQRIVLTEKNKIGGNKKLVFIVPGSKLEKLVFTRDTTIQL